MDLSNRYVKTNTKADFESYISEKKVNIKNVGLYQTLMSVIPNLLGRVTTLSEIDSALKTILVIYRDSKATTKEEGLFAVYLLIWVMDAITYPEKFNSVGITENIAVLYAKLWPDTDAISRVRAVILDARNRHPFHIPS